MSSALQEFAERRRRGADTLDALAQALDDVGGETADAASRLRHVADRARRGRFVVLLIGCFSSGKSTLLNALLGQPVLPVKVNPCTAILTELVYADTPSVEVRFTDGTAPEHLSPEAFVERYQLQTASPDSAGTEASDRFGTIDRAVVGWPLPLLRDGVVLLDTPGLDDDMARTRRTLASLPDADAVIVVLNATRFLTELERKTLRRDLLPMGLTNLFFPVTMVDLLQALSDNPERERAEMMARATEFLGPLCHVDGRDRLHERLFPLNARGGLQARWDRGTGPRRQTPDAEKLVASGLPPFEASLEHFLVEERGRAQLLHLVGQARRVRDSVARQASMDRATASASVSDLERRQAELGPKFEELDAIATRVGQTVDRFIERQQALVWQDLRDFLAQTEAALPQAIGAFDLGSVAGLDLLTPRGRQRVERKLQIELEAWLEARVAQWQDQLQPRIERSLRGLQREIAADAHAFDDIAERIATDFAGGALRVRVDGGDASVDPVERWFSVAMGALLLSPGAMAAGWAEGYEGALKGGAKFLGVRMTILALGALLGPIGWAGLLLYAMTDAALLVVTGGGQLRKLRKQVAQGLRGKLVAQADAVRDDIATRVGEGLAPVRDGLVGAARQEADELSELLRSTIHARQQAAESARERSEAWDRALAALDKGLAEVASLTAP